MANSKQKICFLCVLCVSMAAGPGTTFAQRLARPDTVATRDRDGLDPNGATLGSFRLFPEMALEHLQDDNVFATPVIPVSDSALVIRPDITIRSDWSRNSLEAGIQAAMYRYADLDSEDHDDSRAYLEGRWDTANDGFFYGSVSQSVEHEGRESVNDARGFERTEIDRDVSQIGYEVTPGRMAFRLELESQTLDFNDVMGPNGPINNDDRDRDRFFGLLRVGFELSQGYTVFLQAVDRSIDYDSRFDDDGFERSGDGQEVHIGATMNVSDVLFGDIYVGRKTHDYDDDRFASIGGSAYGIDLAWNITALTTLNFLGRQEVAPTTVLGAAGVDESSLGVRADHELLRNLVLSLEWSEQTDDFKGIDREDINRNASFGVRYLMNRRLEVGLTYTKRERKSDTNVDRQYSKNLVSIQFTGQL